MQADRNSTWKVSYMRGVPAGIYRVLAHSFDEEVLILFQLHDGRGHKRPIMVDIALFNRFIQLGRVEPVEYSIPSYQLIEDKAINPKHLDIRDKRLGLIQGLLNDPNFLFEIASNLKSNKLINHAILVGTNVQNLHRFLNLYWKYGQDLNALLPSYVYSGGMGIQRLAGTKKRGMPIRFLTPTIQASPGVNTEESDKIKFLSAMKNMGLKAKKFHCVMFMKKCVRIIMQVS